MSHHGSQPPSAKQQADAWRGWHKCEACQWWSPPSAWRCSRCKQAFPRRSPSPSRSREEEQGQQQQARRASARGSSKRRAPKPQGANARPHDTEEEPTGDLEQALKVVRACQHPSIGGIRDSLERAVQQQRAQKRKSKPLDEQRTILEEAVARRKDAVSVATKHATEAAAELARCKASLQEAELDLADVQAQLARSSGDLFTGSQAALLRRAVGKVGGPDQAGMQQALEWIFGALAEQGMTPLSSPGPSPMSQWSPGGASMASGAARSVRSALSTTTTAATVDPYMINDSALASALGGAHTAWQAQQVQHQHTHAVMQAQQAQQHAWQLQQQQQHQQAQQAQQLHAQAMQAQQMQQQQVHARQQQLQQQMQCAQPQVIMPQVVGPPTQMSPPWQPPMVQQPPPQLVQLQAHIEAHGAQQQQHAAQAGGAANRHDGSQEAVTRRRANACRVKALMGAVQQLHAADPLRQQLQSQLDDARQVARGAVLQSLPRTPAPKQVFVMSPAPTPTPIAQPRGRVLDRFLEEQAGTANAMASATAGADKRADIPPRGFGPVRRRVRTKSQDPVSSSQRRCSSQPCEETVPPIPSRGQAPGGAAAIPVPSPGGEDL